jgi:SAM-dependent methyltransferase
MSFEAAYSEVYDALYSDKNYEAEAEYITQTLMANGVESGASVLEVGIGTGRHAELLQKALGKFRILGVEPSRAMADQARSRGLEVFEGNAQDALPQIDEGKHDAVLALFHVVSYVTDESELKEFFNQVSRILKPGGIFLFDVWHRDAVLHLGMSERVKRVLTESGNQVLRLAVPEIDLANSIGIVNYEIFVQLEASSKFERIVEKHTLKFFSRSEVSELSRRSGLRLVESHEFLTRKEASEETWGVSYVLEKPLS